MSQTRIPRLPSRFVLTASTIVALSAAAAVACPSDALVVNNFGAVLRFLGEAGSSIAVLRYARTL